MAQASASAASGRLLAIPYLRSKVRRRVVHHVLWRVLACGLHTGASYVFLMFNIPVRYIESSSTVSLLVLGLILLAAFVSFNASLYTPIYRECVLIYDRLRPADAAGPLKEALDTYVLGTMRTTIRVVWFFDALLLTSILVFIAFAFFWASDVAWFQPEFVGFLYRCTMYSVEGVSVVVAGMALPRTPAEEGEGPKFATGPRTPQETGPTKGVVYRGQRYSL